MPSQHSYLGLLKFSFASVFLNFFQFIKIALVPYLLCFPISYLQNYIVLETSINRAFGLIIMSTGLFFFPVFFAFLTNWHRYIIFEGKRPWEFKLIEFSNYTLKFALAAMLIFLLLSIPYVVSIMFSFYLGIKLKASFYIIVIIQWIFLILFLFFYSKLALIFPAAAAGHSISLKRIYAISKGYFWKILTGFLTFLILSIILNKTTAAAVGHSNYLAPIIWIFYFIFVAMNAAWLSRIYKNINL